MFDIASKIAGLFTGGTLNFAVVGVAIVTILGFVGRFLYKVKKSGIDQQKAEQADAYSKHLQEISDAANARPTGGVQSDPYNRDRP